MAERTPRDFGSKLREARERKGVTLRQIAAATKISVAVLEALERNDVSRLPGGIFSRAFVRSYAAEVGLDPEATIQDFVAQFPGDAVVAGHSAADPIEDNEALESDRRAASTVLWIVLASVPIAGAVLYFATVGHPAREESRKTQRASAARAEPTPPPPIAPAAAEPASTDRPEPPASAQRPSAPPVPATTPASSTSSAGTVDSPAPPAATTGGTQSEPARPEAVAGRDDLLKIGLTVRKPVWVSATVDGQRAIERLLQTGEQQSIDVRRELVITAGDASAITMTVNGAAARPLGKAGEVVTARVNLTNFKDYLLR